MQTLIWSPTVSFQPWVGSSYWKSDPRVLLLGDSHYGKSPEDAGTDFTSAVLRRVIANDPEIAPGVKRTFAKAAGVVSNCLLNDGKRNEFWASVSFYNYLQTLAGPGPGVSVRYERFKESEAAFKEVLRILHPHLVIVLGHRLWGHMTDLEGLAKRDRDLPDAALEERYREVWRYPTIEPETSLIFHIKHPSRAFNFRSFHQLYVSAAGRLKEKRD